MSANRRGKRSTKAPRRPQAAFIPPPQPQHKPPTEKDRSIPAVAARPATGTGTRQYPWDLPGLSQEDLVMPATVDENAAIRKLELQVAEINTSLKFIKLIGGFLALSAVGLFGFEYTAVQRLVRIEQAILALQKESAEMRADSRERNATIASSLERIEKSLAHNQGPAGKPTP
jgi:hypothetical protein